MTIETFEKDVPCIYGSRIVKIEYDNINKTALQYHSYNGRGLMAMLPGKSNIELCGENLSIFRYVIKNFTSFDVTGSSSNDFIDFMEYLSTFKSDKDEYFLNYLQEKSVVRKLKLENESKNIQIQELIQKLKEKDDLNELGQDKFNHVDHELVDLQTEVIDNLTLENESKNIQIEELIQKLKEKDDSIKELEDELNEFGEDKSKYLERELVYLQTEVIDNLTLENESKNIQIQELIQKLKEKDNSLKELEYDLINLTI